MRRFDRSAISLVVICAAMASAAPASAESWRAARVLVCGSDSSVWVVGASLQRGVELPLVQFWYGSTAKEASSPEQRLSLQPVKADPLMVGADAQVLRLLYSDLTVAERHPLRGDGSAARWRSESLQAPLAWAGNYSDDTFYALAHAAALLAPASAPASGKGKPAAAEAGATGLKLLTLEAGVWRRSPGPAQAERGESFWIAARGRDVYAFWKRGAKVWSAHSEGAQWEAPVEVCSGDDLIAGCAGFAEDGPLFVAGRSEGGQRVRLELLRWIEPKWVSAGLVREGSEELSLAADTCGVGLARGKLVVARPTSEGGIEFAEAEPAVSPAMRFTPLSLSTAPSPARTQRQEALVLGLLLGILTLVLWTRRHQAVRPVTLPPEVALAGVWRRILATFVDMLPAVLFTSYWWYPKFEAMAARYGLPLDQAQMAELMAQVAPESYANVLLYGLWCLAWEAAAASTPGKLLFGCRVISVDGGRPAFRQVVARNLMRIVMVSLGLEGLLVTLLTILIVTRNRQRMGDLLAGTIVVERAGPATPSGDDAIRGDQPADE